MGIACITYGAWWLSWRWLWGRRVGMTMLVLFIGFATRNLTGWQPDAFVSSWVSGPLTSLAIAELLLAIKLQTVLPPRQEVASPVWGCTSRHPGRCSDRCCASGRATGWSALGSCRSVHRHVFRWNPQFCLGWAYLDASSIPAGARDGCRPDRVHPLVRHQPRLGPAASAPCPWRDVAAIHPCGCFCIR